MSLDPVRAALIRDAIREANGDKTAAAKALGLSRVTVIRYAKADSQGDAEAQPNPPGKDFPDKVSGTEDTLSVSRTLSFQIRTLEDALAHAEVDTSVWRVKSWECVYWESQAKIDPGGGKPEEIVRTPLWRLLMRLERINPVTPPPILVAMEEIYDRMQEVALNPVPYSPPKKLKRLTQNCLEIDAFDIHFGKLAWEPEAGDNYDLKIAEGVFESAVDELLEKAQGFHFSNALFPIGNDMIHIDNLLSQTTSGTPQDCDGRYAKIFSTAVISMIRAVERVARVVPNVDVLYVPGNHDRLSSYHVARELAAWFKSDERITIDVAPRTRKYYRFGTTLLGFTHGNKEKKSKLPIIMATERPIDWSLTKFREWHIGHEHRSKVFETIPVDTHEGVKVRTLQALTATDAWHYEQGYIGNQRSAEAFVWSPNDGLAAQFYANATD